MKLEELKKEYKRLAMINHPDKGGDAEIMKAINNEYEVMFNLLKNRTETTTPINETPAEYIEIINVLINLANINIEIVGSWIWVDGDTYEVKEQLKEIGFQWSKSRKKWYLGEITGSKNYKKESDFDKLRNKYGSQTIQGNKKEKHSLN